jgi:amino-acid N-acetyltransferase
MNIAPASQNSFSAAIALLENCKLPTSDIQPHTILFVMEENNKVIGTVALEHDGCDALLRSLSVEDDYRNKGVATQLVSFIENYARLQEIQIIYLLTTTAVDFFAKKGYQRTERTQAPEFIQHTSEFASLCPSSATLMKKFLT